MNNRKLSVFSMCWINIIVVSLCACSGQSNQDNLRLAESTRKIGEAYMRQGDYTAALRELIKARDLDPQNHIVYDDLGICYFAKERMPDAIANFKKAIALKPSYTKARNNLGAAYLKIKEWDAAIAVFNEITQDALYATPHYPLYNLGKAYYHKGQYQKSLHYYKKALKLQENYFLALMGTGRTYLAMNEGRKALQYLERAVKIAPNFADIHYELGEAYLLVGRMDQALLSYETAIDLALPESEVALKAKQRVKSIQ